MKGVLAWSLKSAPGPSRGYQGKSSFILGGYTCIMDYIRSPNLGPSLGSNPESLGMGWILPICSAVSRRVLQSDLDLPLQYCSLLCFAGTAE